MTDNIKARLTAAVADRYTIERELGGGGMSRVFVALEHSLGRRVVIKTLPEDASFGGAAAERFRREILTAARIDHANIVSVLAAGDIDGTPYFVMPWVDGDSLRQLLQRGRVPLAQAVSVLRDVARALAAAHAQGVVHRDIKPENILLSGGAARVTDFGVAKALSVATQTGAGDGATNAGMTGLGISIGTPAYMAPEQLAADPALDHRADIYAWGLIAYELFSGQHPFAGMTGASLMQAQFGTNPQALALREPSVPAAISTLVAKALSKDPAQRSQSANELIQTLDDTSLASPGESSRDRPVGAQSEPRATARGSVMSPGKTVAIVAVVMIAAAAFGAWKIINHSDPGDDHVIAVAPFRVGGAPEAVHYLREGVADLMVPQLASIDSVHPISSRQMFDTWRRAAGSMEVDLDDAAALAAAQKIGAGRLILGTIAGTATDLVISASIKRVSSGATLASDTVHGVADSAVAMTARLTSKLMLLSDGATNERLRTVMQAKPAAITSFLNGERYYRSGRYADAIKQFRTSYAADSTFPLVPLRIYMVNGWLTSGQVDGPWVERALSYRSRLTGADSLLLEAYADPLFQTGGTPPLENMERVWRIAQRANSAELWYVAADNYMHSGLALGYNDAMARALKGFKLAEAIDSSYVGGLEHQPVLYLIFGDSVAARAANRRQARIDSTGDYYIIGNAQLQVALAQPSELPAIAHAITQLPANVAVDVAMMIQAFGTIMQLPQGTAVVDSLLASERVRSSLVPGTYEVRAMKDVYLNAGRIAEADRYFASDTSVLESARAVLNALYWDADTANAARAAERIGRWQNAKADTTGTVANNLPRLAYALWSVEHGDTASARKVLNDFRAYRAPALNVSRGFPTKIYGKLLESRVAVKTRATNAKQLIDDANASVLATPRLDRRDVRSLANLMIAGMYDEIGEPKAALVASSRRDMQLAVPVYASAFLRLQANAAEKAGDRETAIHALRAYIELRARADASLQPDVQSAKDRLKALEKKS